MKNKKLLLGLAAAITLGGGGFAYASTQPAVQEMFQNLTPGVITTLEDGGKALKTESIEENGMKAETGIYVAPDANITDEELYQTLNEDQELGELEYSFEISTDELNGQNEIIGKIPAN